jgi:hypothetical protein
MVRFADPVREKQRLVETPLFEPAHVERHRHNEVNVHDQTDIRCHPFAQRQSQCPAWSVLELVHGLAQRALKIADRQGLIEQRRLPSAPKARMLRTVGERLGRVEGPAASRAHRSLYQGEISPAGGTEKRNVGITDRIIAEGTGGRKDKIQNASEEAHSTSKFQTTIFKR